MEPARTITIQEPPEYALRLRENAKPAAFIHKLTDIMATIGEQFYAQWKDPLSLELLEWGCEIIAIDLIEAAQNEEEFIQAARFQLIKLVNEVMIDTLFKKPELTGRKPTLKEPALVVETRWTCERQFLTECQHGKNLTLVTHDFAIAVLNWALSLISRPEEQPVTEFFEGSSYPTPEAYFFYRTMVRQAYAAHQLKVFTQEAQENSELMKIFVEMIDKRAKEHVKKADEESKAALQEVEKKIKAIELNSDKKLQILNHQAAELSQQVNEKEQDVIRLQEQSNQQRIAIANLQAAYRQRCMEVEALRAQVNKKRPWWKFW